jgi:hypothetical protein
MTPQQHNNVSAETATKQIPRNKHTLSPGTPCSASTREAPTLGHCTVKCCLFSSRKHPGEGSYVTSFVSDDPLRAGREQRCPMRVPEFDHVRATRRSGAFAVLTLRAIEKIKNGQMTGVGAAVHFERLARTHRLRETGQYDPKLVDILITRVRHTKEV